MKILFHDQSVVSNEGIVLAFVKYNTTHLKRIDIIGCKQLWSVPEISTLAELALLHIDQWPNLEEISLGHLKCQKNFFC